MRGLIWTSVIWGVLLVVIYRSRRTPPEVRRWLTRENLAVIVALLGTFSIAAQTDADEVLRQPLAIERIVRGGLAALALAMVGPVLVNRIRAYQPGHRSLVAVFAYLVWAGISTIYSAAPLVTAAKVFELTAGVAPLVAIALGPEPRRHLRNTVYLLMALHGVLLAVAVVGFFAVPSLFARAQGRPGFLGSHILAAPYAHNNAISAYGAMLLVFSLAMFFDRKGSRGFWLGSGVVGLLAVVLASGRQGVGMALAGAAVVLWFQRRQLLLLLLGPAIAASIYIFRHELFDALSRGRPENFTNLTGRLYWWEAAIDTWAAHPWTGWGYAAGGRFVALESIGRGTTSNVHSGYVEALVGVGILGMVPLVYLVVRILIWSVRTMAARTDVAIAVLIVPLMLRTAVSQGFGGWLNTNFLLFVALAILADRDQIDRRLALRRHFRPALEPSRPPVRPPIGEPV